MTKHTNKLLVTFEHPEILQQFNDYFKKKYGTVRGHRAKVIEELITNFNRTQTIQKFEPEYLKKINDLQDQLQHLQHENTKLSEDNNILITKNQKNMEQLNNLNQQLQQYEQTKEANNKLSKEVKNNKLTIDDLNKKLNTLQAKYEQTLINHTNDIKQLSMEYNKNLEEKDKQITEKEEKNEALTGVIIKLKDDIHNIKEMNVIQRIFKRYPEEKIIELKQP